jgi:hypothetical protein
MLEQAAAHLDRLIRQDPKVAEYREVLAEALAVLGRLYRESGWTAEAMCAYHRAGEILERSPPRGAEELYHLAGVLAQCATLSATGAAPPVGDRPAECPADLDRAMDAMRRAIAAGFRNLDRLRQDTNLDPLRSRADFRALEQGLMDADFPAEPFAP